MGRSTVSNEKLYEKIGERIAECRHKKSLTQENLANEIDVSIQYISNLERGIVGASVETIIKICRALEVSSDYILLGDNSTFFSKTTYIDLKQLNKKELDIISSAINVILSSGRNK